MVVLGKTYERLGEQQLAQQTYEKAVNIPGCTNTSAFFYLGLIYEK